MGADQLVKAVRYLHTVGKWGGRGVRIPPDFFRAPLKHSTFKRRPNTKREPIKGDTEPPHTQEVATPNANHKREDTKPKR